MAARHTLLLDTNVVIDYLDEREPFCEKARLLMIAGRVGEFDLWITTSQMTDLVYILSEGGATGRMPRALERLRALLSFVNVYAATDRDIDRMLATAWRDPEDALMFEAALGLKADFIVTRNAADFESDLVPACDCDELFAWLERERGIRYDEIAI